MISNTKLSLPANTNLVIANAPKIKIIAFASSTGGTEALEKILRALPAAIPPVLIVQHMPSGFTKLFADRLNTICAMEVREARNHECLLWGQALVAPGDYHMRLEWVQRKMAVECFAGQKIHGVMPSADILFESAANFVREKAIGVVLTGMGADGARGLLKMRQCGARTIAQDQATSVVYGMPKIASDMGAAEYILPLDMVAGKIMSLL
ncbi:MAG: chemotaxis protein CheB [Clostridiales bacterium]|jgi:two-component system chemotaxis response regulator CheB|nr:chemotaxis protein CheB [Clostridiales bacterium]